MAGRGGAGNLLYAQQESQRAATDLEAQEQAAGQSTTKVPAPSQEYAHTGRGGAGNYYSPKDLSATGTFHTTTLDPNDDQATDVGSLGLPGGSGPAPITHHPAAGAGPMPVRKYGRGGAGNMAFRVTEDEERRIRQKMDDEKQMRDKLQADVEASVKATLAEPPKAKLPHDGEGMME